jgi:hypothetical protein
MSDVSEQLDLEPVKEPHPIRLVVTDDLQRSRLTVFFRLLLVIPVALWLALWAIAAFLVVIVAWFAGLFTGRVPDGLHRFLASFVRCSVQVSAYFVIAANPYPSFTGAPGYPVDVSIADPVKQSRLTIFFRGILVIPAYIVFYVLSQVAQLVSIACWFYAVFTARQHKGMQELLCYCLRYQAQTTGYYFLLTQRYPSFSDD